jgi:DNA-binding NarL/FixJ family response regulator
VQPIRTASEMPVRIKIPNSLRVPLYQKLAQKVEELHILGMPLKAIAESLNISINTIKKIRKYTLSLRKE